MYKICSLQSIPDIVVYFYSQKLVLAWSLFLFFLSVLDVRRTKGNGGGADPTRRNPSSQCKPGFQKFAGNIKKSEICRCWLPFFFSCVRCARAFFFPRSARTHAVLVRLERRLVRFFFVLEEELRPPFCFKQQSFRAGRALRRSRSPVPPLPSVPFVSRKRPGHSRSPPS